MLLEATFEISKHTVFTIEKHAVSERVWRALDHKSSLAILILTSKTFWATKLCKAQEGMTQWISWFWLLRLFSILSTTLPHFSHKLYLMGFLNCSCEQRGKPSARRRWRLIWTNWDAMAGLSDKLGVHLTPWAALRSFGQLSCLYSGTAGEQLQMPAGRPGV